MQQEGDELNADVPELASLSNRFSFFEHYEEKEEERKKKKTFRMSPPREGTGAYQEVSLPISILIILLLYLIILACILSYNLYFMPEIHI